MLAFNCRQCAAGRITNEPVRKTAVKRRSQVWQGMKTVWHRNTHIDNGQRPDRGQVYKPAMSLVQAPAPSKRSERPARLQGTLLHGHQWDKTFNRRIITLSWNLLSYDYNSNDPHKRVCRLLIRKSFDSVNVTVLINKEKTKCKTQIKNKFGKTVKVKVTYDRFIPNNIFVIKTY